MLSSAYCATNLVLCNLAAALIAFVSSHSAVAAIWCESGGSDCRPTTVLVTEDSDFQSAKDLIPNVRRQLIRRGISPAVFEPIAAVSYPTGNAALVWKELIEPNAKVVMVGGFEPAIDLVSLAKHVSTVVYVTHDDELEKLRKKADLAESNMVIASLVQDLSSKHVEIFQAILPTKRTICIVDEKTAVHAIKPQLERVGFIVRQIAFKTLLEAPNAVGMLKVCAGIFVPTRDSIHEARGKLVPLLVATRVPCVFDRAAYVELGGLISYEAEHAASVVGMYDAVASVLTGLAARELPDVRAHRYALSVNRITAAGMPNPLPPALLRNVNKWY
jgi:ABC-type uncharacterized transport system substrate-binding protein